MHTLASAYVMACYCTGQLMRFRPSQSCVKTHFPTIEIKTFLLVLMVYSRSQRRARLLVSPAERMQPPQGY